MKTAIVTDSNSGITQALSADLGVYTIPMPFLINGEQFHEDINLTQEQFYEKLKDDKAQRYPPRSPAHTTWANCGKNSSTTTTT